MRFWFSGPRILGIRPGISFSANDFKRQRRSTSRPEPIEGSFIYVIKAPNDRVKIGRTTNPSARLSALQTGSHMRLRYAFIGITPGDGYDIERAAHEALEDNRLEGEWFDVPSEKAIAVVTACAWKLGHLMDVCSLAQADRVLAMVSSETQPAGPNLWMILGRIIATILLMIIGLIAGLVIIAFTNA